MQSSLASDLTRRRALTILAGTATALAVPGTAEAKPRRKPRRITATASDGVLGVDVRTIRLTVGTPGGVSSWPDATNMPSVSGSTLTYYPNYPTSSAPSTQSLTSHSGNFDTTSNNQVVEAMDIAGALVINHANVVVRRCRMIAPTSEICPLFIANTASGTLTVDDCVMDGSNKEGGSGIHWDNSTGIAVTVRRVNLSRVENGFGCLSNFDVRDSWLHDFAPLGADPHTDGVQTSAGVSNVNIIHNNFDFVNNGPTNSCVQLNVTTTDNVNWLVENNKLILHPVNGAYCARLPLSDASGNNIRFKNNRLEPGVFGYVTPSVSNITEWSGNVDDSSGAGVP